MANSTTTNTGTVLTIPAKKIWRGSVTLCATLAVAVGGSAATQYPSVDVSGSGATWADGDVVLKLALFVPAVSNSAVAGMLATSTISTGLIYVQTRANPISLILNYGDGVTAAATAVGEVI